MKPHPCVSTLTAVLAGIESTAAATEADLQTTQATTTAQRTLTRCMDNFPALPESRLRCAALAPPA